LRDVFAFMDRHREWLEFGNNRSNQSHFNRGNATAAWKNQADFLVGIVAAVGPKR
jgi:hypothetical protein